MTQILQPASICEPNSFVKELSVHEMKEELEVGEKAKSQPCTIEEFSKAREDSRRKEINEALLSSPFDHEPIVMSAPKDRSKFSSTRGSRYRGVSRNGKKWQVFIFS
jgi:hypothetical protein